MAKKYPDLSGVTEIGADFNVYKTLTSIMRRAWMAGFNIIDYRDSELGNIEKATI